MPLVYRIAGDGRTVEQPPLGLLLPLRAALVLLGDTADANGNVEYYHDKDDCQHEAQHRAQLVWQERRGVIGLGIRRRVFVPILRCDCEEVRHERPFAK